MNGCHLALKEFIREESSARDCPTAKLSTPSTPTLHPPDAARGEITAGRHFDLPTIFMGPALVSVKFSKFLEPREFMVLPSESRDLREELEGRRVTVALG
jgi:hypothetical protein